METNEGDTPRIVISAFSQMWTDPRRGSLPVSWAIDPQLGEEFPALFDYFSATAGVNDSFISGPGGCGYVYYGRMSDAQIKGFATRCGRLMKEYGPAIVDTYGQTGASVAATVSVLGNFSRYAKVGGVGPEMYISQPTQSIKEMVSLTCNETQLDAWLPDGTPLVCTSRKGLFYVMPSPGAGITLAGNINAVGGSGNQFITAYGGLKWTASAGSTDDLYTFWGSTIAHLDADIVPVGAQEMARLAREARRHAAL
jgi:hypothetical protein